MEKKELQNLINECKALLEQTEPYQQKMKAGHSRKKKRVIGHGGQPNTPPFVKKPSMERSKSAPPIGETKMNELRFKDIADKNKWTQIDLDILKQNKKDKDEEININDELFDLIDKSYAYLGGHIDFKKPSDIPSSHTGWAAIDVDLDKKPDALRFWKIDKFGNVKLTGGGSDGTPLGKSSYIQYTVEMLKEDGVFAEMSDAIAHIMITRYNIPSVNDPDVVQKLLGSDKKITWIGEDPSGKYPNHKGWYVRELGGEPHKKIMLGNPLGVKKLNEVIRKKGSKFCLYSKKSDKNLGCYSSKKGAKKRERQVQYFKSLEEGVFSDIMGFITPQQQKKPQIKYTDYNKVYDRIYVGSAPILGGKLIEDAVSRFGRIFVMSKEVADLIKDKLPDNVDIAYAIEDTLNPTQDEKTKLKQVAVKAKAFLNTHPKSDILFACSKGLNRSAAGACLTMIALGIKPEDAIQRVEAARGPKTLTLSGPPQEHAGFVPIIKQIEQKK